MLTSSALLCLGGGQTSFVWRQRFWKGVHAMRRWDELEATDLLMNLDYLEHLAATFIGAVTLSRAIGHLLCLVLKSIFHLIFSRLLL